MPIYEYYYCLKCAAKFEQLRSMAQADDPATCAKGHTGAARTLSMFATVTRGGGGAADMMPSGGGCGCGGGGCGCGH
jgi:putative FmdB family regulatory protein